jgi:hypothetical protein
MNKKLVSWMILAIAACVAAQPSIAAFGSRSPTVGHDRFASCQEAVGECPMYKNKDPSASDFLFWLLTGICARFAALAAGLARGTGLE